MIDPLEQFVGFDLYRIASFEESDGLEEAIARLIAPLRAAHALKTQVLWCILSAQSGADTGLTWGLGFRHTQRAGAASLKRLGLPAGVTAHPFEPEGSQELLKNCREWIALQGFPIPRSESIESEELRGAILAQIAHRPFACIVQANPVHLDEISDELLPLDQAARTGQLPGRGEYASSRTSADLAIERYGDLVAARQLGGWNVQIDIGAPEGETPAVAQLLATALDIPGLALSSEGIPGMLEISEAWRQPRHPFLASTRQLATVMRSPSRELPGVALRRRMPFDLNAEHDDTPGSLPRSVDLGATLDSSMSASGRFTVDTSTLNRHALVCGATGSGKSQTVQHLLEQLTSIEVPWLVIEPAKSEYRSMRSRLAARGYTSPVHVIRLGDSDSPPLGLNPLEPAPGFPLQTHLDMVSALFVASFDAAEPFPQILSEALRRCYGDLGWVLATGEYKLTEMGVSGARGHSYPRYPTLTDLQRTARDVVHDVGYGQEVRDNVLGFVDVRLGSLRNGTPGRFFEGGHSLDLNALHKSNVVLEIEDVGNDLDKAFVIGTMILRLYEHLRVRGPTGELGLTHVTVVEEAHRLLRRAEPGGKQNQAVELFGAMLSEVRAFGEGIIIAEQIPTKILSDVLKNSALQIVHRLPSVEDRSVLAGTTNMSDEQAAYVVSLRPGFAAAFREGMDAPVYLKVDHPGRLPSSEPPVPLLGALRRPASNRGCDAQCSFTACTERELAVGPQLAHAVPELEFWLELVFLAFISETPIVRPGWVWTSALRERLANMPIRRCVLAGLVEATVTARWAQVADFYDPQRLVTAMVATVNSILLDSAAAPETSGFAAGRFLIRTVYDELKRAGDSAPPHPLTAYWRETLGIALIDADTGAQRAWLEMHPLFSYPGHTNLVRGTALGKGSDPPSRLERLSLPLSGGVTGPDGVTAACKRATSEYLDAAECTNRFSAALGLATASVPEVIAPAVGGL